MASLKQNPGQNGYSGSSSLTPGQTVAPANVSGPNVADSNPNWQTRPVSAEQVAPTTFGHKNPNANPAKIPGAK